ncbi:MAG: glycine cleavage system aminomethyltransferase GcvT, partial [Candidatus Riflebacteria bacterium]|nr:glycine cleavage system aminomethyltransferase GcvT [Candidatus Riflebacteria bacterium]
MFCESHEVVNLWKTLIEAGKEVELKPIGLSAKESLRLEN